MNERIREIAEEAGMVIVNDEFSTYGKFAEKFAKLIVRECALICESRPGPGDDVRSRQHCSLQILEHFGVAE